MKQQLALDDVVFLFDCDNTLLVDNHRIQADQGTILQMSLAIKDVQSILGNFRGFAAL
jgi:hypothetical protein